jgi:hypothetical protein
MSTQLAGKLKISPAIIGLAMTLLFGVLMFRNGIYLMACVLTAYLIVAFLFRKNRPGMIVFALLLQWVQVIAYVIWMNSSDWDINHLSRHGDNAVLIGCLGLVCIAAVLSLAINKVPIVSESEFARAARTLDEKKILLLYSVSTLFLGGLQFALGSNSGFVQILATLGSIKWVFFLVYGFICWTTKKNWLIFIVMVAFEFTSALYSYFSNFKEVILMTIALGIMLVRQVSFKQVLGGLLAGTLLAFVLIAWTAIKGDYRNFVNQGSGQQVVEVSRTEALDKITEKVGSLNWEDFRLASYMLLYRLQYILHLAKTMDRVPEVLPHEEGNVWLENITYVLEPRLFFPDKPIYEATIKTNKYTGIRYTGRAKGASFSLGYFADSYVDFGYFGMYLPLALIGLLLSGIYRLFIGLKNVSIVFRYAIINVVFYEFCAFEADGLFLFGRLTLLTLVYFVLAKTVFPRLQSWLYKKSS